MYENPGTLLLWEFFLVEFFFNGQAFAKAAGWLVKCADCWALAP